MVVQRLTKANEENPKRKCFRMIGGILAERTVDEVLPAIQTNLEGVSLLFLEKK